MIINEEPPNCGIESVCGYCELVTTTAPITTTSTVHLETTKKSTTITQTTTAETPTTISLTTLNLKTTKIFGTSTIPGTRVVNLRLDKLGRAANLSGLGRAVFCQCSGKISPIFRHVF